MLGRFCRNRPTTRISRNKICAVANARRSKFRFRCGVINNETCESVNETALPSKHRSFTAAFLPRTHARDDSAALRIRPAQATSISALHFVSNCMAATMTRQKFAYAHTYSGIQYRVQRRAIALFTGQPIVDGAMQSADRTRYSSQCTSCLPQSPCDMSV